MVKYLYLTKREWVLPWVLGGKVPISPASAYFSDNRLGIFTPDENLIHESPVDISGLKSHGIHIENCRNITMTNCSANGVTIPDFHNANYYSEDGLILSFCNKKSIHISRKLGKQACVAVYDVNVLKTIIDRQLGVVGRAGECTYTAGHQRNHFLKSTEDEWQSEYRIFWPLTDRSIVELPPKMARSIKMKP